MVFDTLISKRAWWPLYFCLSDTSLSLSKCSSRLDDFGEIITAHESNFEMAARSLVPFTEILRHSNSLCSEIDWQWTDHFPFVVITPTGRTTKSFPCIALRVFTWSLKFHRAVVRVIQRTLWKLKSRRSAISSEQKLLRNPAHLHNYTTVELERKLCSARQQWRHKLALVSIPSIQGTWPFAKLSDDGLRIFIFHSLWNVCSAGYKSFFYRLL